MSDTRPPSSSAADIAAWESKERRLVEEREFRDTMLRFAGDTSTRLEWLAKTIQVHDAEDKERFDAIDKKMQERFVSVDQRIGDNGKTLQYLLGGLAGIVALVGMLATIWGLIK